MNSTNKKIKSRSSAKLLFFFFFIEIKHFSFCANEFLFSEKIRGAGTKDELN